MFKDITISNILGTLKKKTHFLNCKEKRSDKHSVSTKKVKQLNLFCKCSGFEKSKLANKGNQHKCYEQNNVSSSLFPSDYQIYYILFAWLLSMFP